MDVHKKLEFTDVFLSSSHPKKLAIFVPEFRHRDEQKVKIIVKTSISKVQLQIVQFKDIKIILW